VWERSAGPLRLLKRFEAATRRAPNSARPRQTGQLAMLAYFSGLRRVRITAPEVI